MKVVVSEELSNRQKEGGVMLFFLTKFVEFLDSLSKVDVDNDKNKKQHFCLVL